MVDKGKRRAVLIAGPTASGKTALAIDMARARGGVIINADSMQVYSVLDRLTARPDAQELAAAPHRLFGHVSPSVRYSTGAWLEDVRAVIQDVDGLNQELIFVGGTGLYFDSLTKGFASVPPIPADVVREVEKLIQDLDAQGRMAMLAEADPVAAERLGVADPQRVVRAVAVRRATGRALSTFQSDNGQALLDGYALEKIVLMPERGLLRQRIADRFEAMMAAGADGEVAALRALDLDPSLPAMKAIGVGEISAWRDGTISRDEAIEKAVTATRQYAKRQSTWFRNRMSDWRFIDPFERR
jgi:tRNA dimethylallyltransferase